MVVNYTHSSLTLLSRCEEEEPEAGDLLDHRRVVIGGGRGHGSGVGLGHRHGKALPPTYLNQPWAYSPAFWSTRTACSAIRAAQRRKSSAVARWANGAAATALLMRTAACFSGWRTMPQRASRALPGMHLCGTRPQIAKSFRHKYISCTCRRKSLLWFFGRPRSREAQKAGFGYHGSGSDRAQNDVLPWCSLRASARSSIEGEAGMRQSLMPIA